MTGQKRGGTVLSRGTIYHLLSNPVYIGKTRHGGKFYVGRHEPIIDQKTWDRTAELLASNRVKRKRSRNVASGRILLGLLFDEAGNRFTPSHCQKQGRRYAYYNLKGEKESQPKCADRLPALELEELIIGRIKDLLSKPIDLAARFPALSVKDTRLLVASAGHRAEQLADIGSKDASEFLRNILVQCVVFEAKVLIEASAPTLQNALIGQRDEEDSQRAPIRLECPLLIRRRGSEVRLVLENGETLEPKPIPSLTKAVALSRQWADEIVAGKFSNLDELAKSAGMNRAMLGGSCNVQHCRPGYHSLQMARLNAVSWLFFSPRRHPRISKTPCIHLFF